MLVLAVAIVMLVLDLLTAPPAVAAAAPTWQLPFPCDQVWKGNAGQSSKHDDGDEIDFNRGRTQRADLGDTVVAAAGGRVTRSGHQGSRNGYGNLVVIDHGGGWSSWYAHLQERYVDVDEEVEQGERIGTVGDSTSPDNTGMSPHLHFEIRNGPKQSDIQPAVFDGVRFKYPEASVRSRNCGSGPHEPGPRTYAATADLDGRTEKTLSNHAAPDRYKNGDPIEIVCQDEGEEAYGSKVWDLTSDGLWVADRYVKTGHSGFSPDLPRCELPRSFPAKASLDGRLRKSLSDHEAPDKYAKGDAVHVVCQAHGGMTYHGSTIWDRTTDGLWAVDYYVDTDNTGFVPGIPRCDLDEPGDEGDGGEPDPERKQPEDLRVSQPARDFIAEKEGFRATPYGDQGNRCTIGYGHLIGNRPCTDQDDAEYGTLTEAEAMELLVTDAERKASDLRDLIQDTPLKQHEFDALVSLVYNLGAGELKDTDLHEALRADPPRYDDVPDLLLRFVNDSGEPVCGLHLRRLEEGKIFAEGSYEWRASDDACPPDYQR